MKRLITPVKRKVHSHKMQSGICWKIFALFTLLYPISNIGANEEQPLATSEKLLSTAVTSSEFSTREHALPKEANTKIVRIVDPLDPLRPPVPLLLTNNTGYELRCNELSGLRELFIGLGFDIELLPWMESVAPDDPRVQSSNYQANPAINCDPSGNEVLYVVDYTGHEDVNDIDYPDNLRYFVHFGESSALNMIGCQGLIEAMGFELDEATPMSWDVAHSLFVDVGDEHDIHCIDGDPVGEPKCGEHANHSSWFEPISHGRQEYYCNEGEVEIVGQPLCDEHYQAVNGQCQYVPKNCGNRQHGEIWTAPIANGNQSYSCQDGTVITVGAPTCAPNYTPSGSQCVYVPKNCGDKTHGSSWQQNIDHGVQNWSCHDGVSTFNNVVCDANYRPDNRQCVYVPKNCGSQSHGSSWTETITGGINQCQCNDGSTQCQVQCQAPYIKSGNACVLPMRTVTADMTGNVPSNATHQVLCVSNGQSCTARRQASCAISCPVDSQLKLVCKSNVTNHARRYVEEIEFTGATQVARLSESGCTVLSKCQTYQATVDTNVRAKCIFGD